MKNLKNDIIYYLIKALIYLFESLPRSIALKLAGSIGEAAALLDLSERRLAENNLKRAYKDNWSDLKVKLVARECFSMIARNTSDVIQSRKWNPDDLQSLIDTEGMECFDEAFDRGKGVIGLTGHIGNFELMAAWFASVKKIPLSVVGRKLYDHRLDSLIVENRERFGLENLPSDVSAKRILSVLNDGRMLGVLLDLDSDKVAGYFAPFFGIPANTAAGPVVIGRKTGSPVVPMAMFRKADDRYMIKVLPSFDIPSSDNKDMDILEGLTLCNRSLEELIDHDPTQWMWIHDRWKRKPKTSPDVKDSLEEVLSQ